MAAGASRRSFRRPSSTRMRRPPRTRWRTSRAGRAGAGRPGQCGRPTGARPIGRRTAHFATGWPASRHAASPSKACRSSGWASSCPTGRSCGPGTACRCGTWTPGCRASGRAIRPLSNRGANGIDGVVSTALGAAAAGVGPVVLVVGDVSFLHDLNALVAARLHGLSATIVLVDNDGGGIFSFLSQASTDDPGVGLPDHYEELFGTPHGIDVGPIVTALGGEFQVVSTARPARRAGRVGRPPRGPGPAVPDGARAQRRAPSRGGGRRRRRAGARRDPCRRRWPRVGGPGPRQRRPAAAPSRLHRSGVELGHASRRRSRDGFGSSSSTCRATAGPASRPTRPGQRGAHRPTISRRSCDATRAAPAHVLGYSLGARIALRLAVATRRRSAGSCSRARRRGSPTRPAAPPAWPPTRPAPRGSTRRHRRVRRRVGARAGLREPGRAAAGPRGAPPRRAPAQPAGGSRREPARAPVRAPWSPCTIGSASVTAPTLVIAGALDPAGRARADSRGGRHPRRPPRGRRRTPATPRTSKLPQRSAASSIDFLKEDSAA